MRAVYVDLNRGIGLDAYQTGPGNRAPGEPGYALSVGQKVLAFNEEFKWAAEVVRPAVGGTWIVRRMSDLEDVGQGEFDRLYVASMSGEETGEPMGLGSA